MTTQYDPTETDAQIERMIARAESFGPTDTKTVLQQHAQAPVPACPGTGEKVHRAAMEAGFTGFFGYCPACGQYVGIHMPQYGERIGTVQMHVAAPTGARAMTTQTTALYDAGYEDGYTMAFESGSADAGCDGWDGMLINAMGLDWVRRELLHTPDAGNLTEAEYALLREYNRGADAGAAEAVRDLEQGPE